MKRFKKDKKNNKGFSLVELIVVIAIMAVLVGVLAPTLIGNIEKSRESKDLQNLDTIRQAAVTALSNEAAYNAAMTKIGTNASTAYASSDLGGTASDSFISEFQSILSSNNSLAMTSAAGKQAGYELKLYITKDGAVKAGVYNTSGVPAVTTKNKDSAGSAIKLESSY